MTENKFLIALTNSFKAFLETGSRSNEKLKILHSSISNDLINLLGPDYVVKSLNIGDGKEGTIQGRYINKNVDIVFYDYINPYMKEGILKEAMSIFE